jgi:release factor glutamine methyltransferase
VTVNAPVQSATVGDLRRRIAARLADVFRRDGRNGSPDLDARLLVGHAIGCAAGEVVLRDAALVTPALERIALDLAAARIAGAPVARLLGEKEFWSLPLRLSAETLVPRPETEALVEAALMAVDTAGRREEPLTILDLGTGSGAILLAMLSALPMATGIGVDIAEGGVRMARENAERLGLGGRGRFVVGDWAAAIGGRFDIVVSNPPYIGTAEIAGLPVEVRDHDPHIALDGGEDGLAAYAAIFASLDALLAPSGIALVEVGSGQAGDVAEMARRGGYTARIDRDLAGIERVVKLQRAVTKFGLEIAGEPDRVRSP